MSTELPVLTAADFASDQDVRWCPGCGDYGVMHAVQALMPDPGHLARQHRVHQRYRLLQPLPVLHEHLRHASDPRPCPGVRHGPEMQSVPT